MEREVEVEDSIEGQALIEANLKPASTVSEPINIRKGASKQTEVKRWNNHYCKTP